MEGNLFLTYDEFKHELMSWEKPLAKFVDSKAFQDIYKFVKDEYESGRKVCMSPLRSTQRRRTSSTPSKSPPLAASR
jgi:hypothetical protein